MGTQSGSGTDGAPFADQGALLAVLDDAVAALEGADVTFLVMGGIASAILGRHRRAYAVFAFDPHPARTRMTPSNATSAAG